MKTNEPTADAVKLATRIRAFWYSTGENQLSTDEAARLIDAFADRDRWVSVGERLPDVGKLVLVWADGYLFPCVAYLESSKAWRKNVLHFELCAVTHWQPLPPGAGRKK